LKEDDSWNDDSFRAKEAKMVIFAYFTKGFKEAKCSTIGHFGVKAGIV